MTTITLSLNPEQANVVRAALDLYTRLCLGQLERVGDLVRQDVIPVSTEHTHDRRTADLRTCDAVSSLLVEAKRHLKYPPTGSMGISHPHVDLSGRRAYEIAHVLTGAIALSKHHGTSTDDSGGALDPRFTADPPPHARVVESGHVP